MTDHDDRAAPVPSTMDRRDALKVLGTGVAGLGAAYGVAPPVLERFRRVMAKGQYAYQYFTPAELETVRGLADMIIPRDDRSGSATDAGTVEYMDFVLHEGDDRTQSAWHDGLAWLDAECGKRFGGKRFAACSGAERGQVLDDIAYPERAREAYGDRARWFNRVRDLVGSGFFSSRIGVEDVGYIGNVARADWPGAPPEALRELGVSYAEWDRRYGGLQ